MSERQRTTRLGRILTRQAQYVVSDGPDLWPAIQQVVEGRRKQSFTFGAVLRTRSGLAVMALLLSLVLAAATYMAVSDVGERLFSELTGSGGQESPAGMTHGIREQQTIDGITVTVNRAHFANNRVGIEYTVTGLPASTPDDARRFTLEPMLTDPGTTPGTRFPMAGGRGIRAGDPYGDTEVPPDTMIEVVAFDVTEAQADGPELQLRFTVFVNGPHGNTGPFTFDFSVPFAPVKERRVIEVGETVEAAGVPVRLERLIITPAEVEAIVRVSASDWSMLTPSITTVEPPGGRTEDTPPPMSYMAAMLEEPGTYAVKFRNNDALFEAPGVWTLNIQLLVGMRGEGREFSDREFLNGPWVFEIEVP